MEHCNHSNTVESTINKEILGHKFSGNTLVCKDCGAELWTAKLTSEYNKWLTGLNLKPRIQFKMSHLADQCLEEVLNRFPGSNKAVFVRAMIMVYTLLLKEGPKANEIFNQIYDSDYFRSFLEDSNLKMFQTDVKPLLYLDIQSWGKIFDLKPNEFSAESFYLMMALCVSEDKDLKEFWNQRILPQIETIIKTA